MTTNVHSEHYSVVIATTADQNLQQLGRTMHSGVCVLRHRCPGRSKRFGKLLKNEENGSNRKNLQIVLEFAADNTDTGSCATLKFVG